MTSKAAFFGASSGAVPPTPEEILAADSEIWLHADNINGADNAGLSNGDLLASFSNPGALGDLAQASDSFKPVFQTSVLNGKPVMGFDGIADHIPLIDEGSCDFIHTTGVFEMVLLFRADVVRDTNRPIFGNSFSGTNKGFMVQVHPTGTVRFFITTGSGSAGTINSTGALINPGEWNVIGIRGDGSNTYISRDLTNYTSATISGSLPAGNAGSIPCFFSDVPNITGSKTDGALAFAAVFDRALLAAEMDIIKTLINEYGFAL